MGVMSTNVKKMCPRGLKGNLSENVLESLGDWSFQGQFREGT
jgi:hypothetical protein